MATTLRTLRQLIGIKTGDVLVCEATADSANESSFTDTVRLADRGDNSTTLVGKILYFSEGIAPNLQHEARITEYDSDAATVTFTPEAPDEPQDGDTAELWSVAERIGTISHLHTLINHAIDAVKDVVGEETYDVAQTYSVRTNSLTIPATWAYFGGAEWLHPLGLRYEIRDSHIDVQPGLRTVRLRGRGATFANNRSVYLYGYARALPLVYEDDATPVDAEWIVESVAEALTLGRSFASADPAAAERRANFWSGKAALYRRNVNAARRGLGIALP